MLKRTSSLKSTSRLKNNTTLHKSSNFSPNSTLRSFSTLNRGQSQLKAKTHNKSAGGSSKSHTRHQDVINACKKPTCEICGKPCCGEPHHIISRGAGGTDIPENLIQLCGNCHRNVHSGRMDEDRLLWAVAHRYFTTPTEVRKIIRAACTQN